jgi:hypothetical protein
MEIQFMGQNQINNAVNQCSKFSPAKSRHIEKTPWPWFFNYFHYLCRIKYQEAIKISWEVAGLDFRVN